MKKWFILLEIFFLTILNLGVVNAEINGERLNCNRIYQEGDNYSGITILQEELNIVSSCILDKDGIFGFLTKECVKKFQKENNLASSGVVTSTTCNALNDAYTNKITNVSSNIETYLDCSKYLFKGSKGLNVSYLQKELNAVAACDLKTDGNFGTLTKNCVQIFQKSKNLSATGYVNSTTCKVLNEMYKNKKVITINNNSSNNNNNSNSKTTINPTITTGEINCDKATIKAGEISNKVSFLQEELNVVMSCGLDKDGDFGILTDECVKKFQRKYNLVDDGIVGSNTCKKLNKLYSNIKNNTWVVTVGDDISNVRYKPIIDEGNIFTTLPLGTIMKVYDTINNGNGVWYKIKIDDNYYYISSVVAKKDAIYLNLDTQMVSLYKNGKLVLKTNVVTGTKDLHDTPTGLHYVSPNTKGNDIPLEGISPDTGLFYSKTVKYWMPFVENSIGFHDANWRDNAQFNPSTYKTNGSYGCVNMKTNDAKFLFDNIDKDIPVIVK